jgi:NAD(P)-dependent dehydrogenase (short-subunit alcohol dehydrogenase family)
MNIDYSLKTALVTGSSKGIGYSCAEVLARCGATVYLNSRTEKEGLQALAKLEAAGLKVRYLQGDIASAADIQRMRDTIASESGSLDLLVNNAGVNLFKGLEDTTMEEFDKIIAVDQRGLFAISQAMLPLLKKATGSSIIHIASVHATQTIAGITAYAGAKGAVVAMTRSMAQELGAYGIRVNTVSPGFTETPMLDDWLASTPNPEATMTRVNALHPLNRIASGEDIGNVVAFLASPLARAITGTNLVVDCGLTTRLMH